MTVRNDLSQEMVLIWVGLSLPVENPEGKSHGLPVQEETPRRRGLGLGRRSCPLTTCDLPQIQTRLHTRARGLTPALHRTICVPLTRLWPHRLQKRKCGETHAGRKLRTRTTTPAPHTAEECSGNPEQKGSAVPLQQNDFIITGHTLVPEECGVSSFGVGCLGTEDTSHGACHVGAIGCFCTSAVPCDPRPGCQNTGKSKDSGRKTSFQPLNWR